MTMMTEQSVRFMMRKAHINYLSSSGDAPQGESHQPWRRKTSPLVLPLISHPRWMFSFKDLAPSTHTLILSCLAKRGRQFYLMSESALIGRVFLCFSQKCRLRASASHVDTAWPCLTCPTSESSISPDQMPRRRLIGCSPLMLTRSRVGLLKQARTHAHSHTRMRTQMGEKIDRMKRAERWIEGLSKMPAH